MIGVKIIIPEIFCQLMPIPPGACFANEIFPKPQKKVLDILWFRWENPFDRQFLINKISHRDFFDRLKVKKHQNNFDILECIGFREKSLVFRQLFSIFQFGIFPQKKGVFLWMKMFKNPKHVFGILGGIAVGKTGSWLGLNFL